MTKNLLIIAHAPSKNTRMLAKAALLGASHPDIGEVNVMAMSPFDIQVEELEKADGVMIGTTENIGYMAGATKDMFDRCYNDWLDQKQGMPVAFYIRAGLDGTATKNALTAISNAQKWRMIAEPLILHGEWQDSYQEEVRTLAIGFAMGLEDGIF